MARNAEAVSGLSRRSSTEEADTAGPGDLGSGRPKLDVVDRRRSAMRTARRQATALRGLGVLVVLGALAGTAVAHAMVAAGQQRIDTLQGQVTKALVEQQNLQLARAELESPARVLSIAEHQLGMVVPGSVWYLTPVNPGPSVARAQAAAARAAIARDSAVARHSSRTEKEKSRSTGRGVSTTTAPAHTGATPLANTSPTG